MHCPHSRLIPRLTFAGWGCFAAMLFLLAPIASAQFKEVGPPPFSEAVAHQRIKALLEKTDAGNLQQTITTITGWLVWYRDIFDEELAAAWQRDSRANLPPIVRQLADAKVASAIVESSWRQQRAATFTLANAPMFEDLMARYPASARPFLDDLLGNSNAAQLSPPEIEAVCRILIDLPDTDAWRKNARQILAQYPRVAESLLDQDARSAEQEKAYRAQVLLGELRPDAGPVGARDSRRSGPVRTSGAYQPPVGDETTSLTPNRRLHTDGSHVDETQAIRASPPPIPVRPTPPTPVTLAPKSELEARAAPAPYTGPRSGTLECKAGVIIPQNGEYVFRDLPPGKLQLDYDMKIWDVRVAPGEGTAQRLILTNKRPGEQKRCLVRWSTAP